MPIPNKPHFALKIFTSAQWAQFERDGIFLGAPVDLADGYIHMSTGEQLEGTMSKHFQGQIGLVVAKINLANFGDALKWEISRGGEHFPHLYGPLPLSEVLAVVQDR